METSRVAAHDASAQPNPVKLSIVGFGTVGRWLAKAIHEKRESLATRFGFATTLVSVATARNGFVYREEGLDIPGSGVIAWIYRRDVAV